MDVESVELESACAPPLLPVYFPGGHAYAEWVAAWACAHAQENSQNTGQDIACAPVPENPGQVVSLQQVQAQHFDLSVIEEWRMISITGNSSQLWLIEDNFDL